MVHGEPREGGVTPDDYDQKLALLRRRQAKGGKDWRDFMEKLARWAEGEGEFDMECQGEFPDWPMEDLRRILDDLTESESNDEQWES